MKPCAGVVDLAVLEPQLDQLREVPLRGDAPAVALEERLAALGGDFVEAVGDRLGGVVLPQLRPGVAALAASAPRRSAAARRSVTGSTVHEVKSTPRPTTASRAAGTCSSTAGIALLEHGDPVVRVLQRPVGRQLLAGAGQLAVDHAVRVADLADREPRRRSSRSSSSARPDSVPKSTPIAYAPRGHREAVGPARRARASAAIASSRARRYSSTTICVSSSTEVSAVGLSSAIVPSWIRFTRSQVASTCT